MTASDISCSLVCENAGHRETNEYLMSPFPLGLDTLIAQILGEVTDYLLFEEDGIYTRYTSRLVRSVYWPNMVSAYMQSCGLRDRKRSSRSVSTVASAKDCADGLLHLFDLLSRSVDLSDPELQLPLPIACKLFSRMSVLLSIPIFCTDMAPLGPLLMDHPLVPHLESWAEKQNAACRLWSPGVISWRRKYRGVGTDESPRSNVLKGKSPFPWWEWLGWSGEPVKIQRDESVPGFVADKGHNVLFGMTAVGAMFVYVGLWTSKE